MLAGNFESLKQLKFGWNHAGIMDARWGTT